MTTLRNCLLAITLMFWIPAQGANPVTPEQALATILSSRSAEDQARDGARHPKETLDFFSVKPGMSVAEGLPGTGWYTRILAKYLESEGSIYGVNYADSMWPLFSFATPDWVASRVASTGQFTGKVIGYTSNGINSAGFTFDSVPEQIIGTVDRVLLIRALHNLNRFEAKAGTRSQALSSVHAMLKDDGLVGVVQHRAPESADDAWANGDQGYLKQSAVIAMFAQAGFELVELA